MGVLTFTHVVSSTSTEIFVTNLFHNGDISVDWGDGTVNSSLSHYYSATGTYTVTITGEITQFGQSCFSFVSGMTSIDIPASVTVLGYGSLSDLTNLESITFNSLTPPTAYNNTWNWLPTTCIIYVPYGSLSTYESASNFPNPNTWTYLETIDYTLNFDKSTYYTCNGNCTVKSTLTDNGGIVTGETVSLTGTGSTLTAVTDSEGIATFNLTNLAENKTLTVSYQNASTTADLVYWDGTTLMDSLYCLGKKLEINLKAKGITDIDFTDGLTSLVNEIPNIEPSIGGIILDTALSITASSNSVYVGDTVTFSGKLSCSFDDETPSDDDMEGYIKTALIEVYNGNTLLGSTSTDNNGEYSYTYTTTTAGTLSVVASYDGTDYYEDCVSSSVSVVVNDVTPVVDSISLTADKSILSYADSESATLSATVLDQFDNPMENQTVEFFNGSTSMGTAQTDSSGVATKTYASSGAGDVSFTATVGSLLSEIFALQDRTFYDASSSSNLSKYTIPSQMSMTYDSTNNCYSCTVPSAASGTDTVILDNLTLSNHCKIQADINMTNTSNNQPRIGLWNGNNGITSRVVISGTSTYFGISNQTKGNDGSNIEIHSGVNISTGNWYTLEVEYNNGSVTAKIYNGNTLIDTITGSESTLASTGNDFGIDIGFGRTANFKIKNIMIQEL